MGSPALPGRGGQTLHTCPVGKQNDNIQGIADSVGDRSLQTDSRTPPDSHDAGPACASIHMNRHFKSFQEPIGPVRRPLGLGHFEAPQSLCPQGKKPVVIPPRCPQGKKPVSHCPGDQTVQNVSSRKDENCENELFGQVSNQSQILPSDSVVEKGALPPNFGSSNPSSMEVVASGQPEVIDVSRNHENCGNELLEEENQDSTNQAQKGGIDRQKKGSGLAGKIISALMMSANVLAGAAHQTWTQTVRHNRLDFAEICCTADSQLAGEVLSKGGTADRYSH